MYRLLHFEFIKPIVRNECRYHLGRFCLANYYFNIYVKERGPRGEVILYVKWNLSGWPLACCWGLFALLLSCPSERSRPAAYATREVRER